MKKLIAAAAVFALLITGCGQAAAKTNEGGAPTGNITVVSREDGSGTRGAFIELFGIEVKDEAGNKKDTTTKEAVIANKTDVMMTNIASDASAIGYCSLGSLNDTVKALDVDGVKASAENVKAGTYKIARPFNIAVKEGMDGLKKDFVDFILSKEGQDVVGGGYIKIADDSPAFAGTKPSGKLIISGSSSVTPIMEKLKEAYAGYNPNATLEIQMSDSSAGMTDAIEGKCDIGMASRELKETEAAQLVAIPIAMDGIAVIVNPGNGLTGLTSEQVKSIFTGEAAAWGDIK